MKNLIEMMLVAVFMSGCAEIMTEEEMPDKWNGYFQYLKTGEMVHTLWAGKNINVGTVTYGIDENANFYATYDCSAPGWKMSETHMYAGTKAGMPLNKPGRPKIGQFPNSGCHSPRVSTFTYRVPLSSLPPCASPGFVVAAHCVVHGPGGKTESAWAEGSYTFSDKGWGWYDDYYYDPPQEPGPVLYGTSCANDSLRIYHLDISTGCVEMILEEYVGGSPGFYDGADYDPVTGLLFFIKYTTSELWINHLQGEEPSFCAGILSGPSTCGTFQGDHYYYINNSTGSIQSVSFTSTWLIAEEMPLDTLPAGYAVNDIAMDSSGESLYILAQNQSGSMQLLRWDAGEPAFFSMPVAVSEDAQIAFGSDGLLYAVSSTGECDTCFYIYTIDLENGMLEFVEDDVIMFDDPFSDLSRGPSL
ncbi:MAG TPA: hypothetical protein PLW31_06770 [Bacteroidales bacterium]|nr:hypothetical protein [Bacteroidales bacterium]HOX77726.1 hypothetical protein [Bacteroidales bacterium]HPI85407.1 hypothetical protein [Bacteroidales bacterium]HPN60343.1 hypothetical protein [Chitinophagaceae bacterium]